MNGFSYTFFIKKIFYLIKAILLFLYTVKSENCNTHSYSEFSYPKAITLANQYKVLITINGIYSFYPKLSTIAHSYNFTGSQVIPEKDSISYINKADISQFSNEDGGYQYVLCIIKHIIYILDKKGKVLFFEDVTNNIEQNYKMSIIPVKYSEGFYYFVLGYVIENSKELHLQYCKLTINTENRGNITFINYLTSRDSIKGLGFQLVNSENVCCQPMSSFQDNILLSCFVGSSFEIIIYNFRVNDQMSILNLTSFYEPEEKSIKFITCANNAYKTESLVCYNDNEGKGKCFNYNINTNTINNIFIEQTFCSKNGYGINTYFFKEANEFVFSCVDDNNNFYMKRIDSSFNVIHENDISNEKFFGCSDYKAFSIIYISEYNVYSIIIHLNCNGKNNVRIFMRTNNNCIMPSGEKEDDNDDDNEDNKDTTETTLPKIETTIITTISKIKTTLPKIKTTIPEYKTTFYNVEKYISTIIKMQDNIEKTDNVESLCKEVDKIYYEGKCICNINKGYYSINSKYSEKCYKKSEIPKNYYFNNITQSYEICYKGCGTCINGGNYSENNCLTCASDYIKEPEKNSSNCVDKCKYLYYYNSLNQYTCTEDEQCPNDANLIIRSKKKCINKCMNDNSNIYQYNGECLTFCPINTEPKEFNICQISNIATCSSSDFQLNLDETIAQENVKLVAKNYANEFYYTVNHISRYLSQNYTMVLYKNSSCIDELNMNVTKIEFDSCIKQLKINNNINEDKELIIAVIDIVNGINPITSFGFFNPDTGEKLDAAKSCSDKNVIMYENILTILTEPLALKLFQEQKINIFDLNDNFYTDICYHFNSPNGKDATLRDRIKTFYPNLTLCDNNCKNKGINMTTFEAECECGFQDLLSKNIFNNELIGDNVLIKESLEEIMDMVSNLNIEVLTCFKDVFNFKYFIKNIGGFIIISFAFTEAILISFYFIRSKKALNIFIYSLIEAFIESEKKKKSNQLKNTKNNNNPPLKKGQKDKEDESKRGKIAKSKRNNTLLNFTKNTTNKNEKDKNISISRNQNDTINNLKVKFREKKSLELNKYKNNINKYKYNPMTISISSNTTIKYNKPEQNLLNKKNIKLFKNKLNKYNYHLIKNKIDINEFLQPTFEGIDYDDVLENDKRKFFEYLGEKIIDNQIIINSFFISEKTKPRPIKIIIFILTIDLYFLINGLFYSESYISEIFNSTEDENYFSFVHRSVDRFIYCTLVGNIIEYIIKFFFVEEIRIKKILLKKRENLRSMKYEMIELLNLIFKKIYFFIIINYIIIIFSWYYISCFNNVYPNIKYDWIKSSLFIIVVKQTLPFIYGFFETCIRYISIKCNSEKLFKISLLFP